MAIERDPDEQAREIVVSRLIEAPRHVVFRAFSDVTHLERWWGPNGFTTTTHSFEFRVGGAWDFVMHGPDGTDYDNWIEWREITPPERLAFLHGERPDDPDAFEGSITLEEEAGGTRVTLRSVFPTVEQRDEAVRQFGAIEGAEQTLGHLADFVRARADDPTEGTGS